jgi:hypothetical protein
MTAPDQIFASPDRQDGWRWPRASQFPEQGPYENVSYTRSDLTPDPATIREAALREAHKVMQEWTYCADGEEEILALIGEKK